MKFLFAFLHVAIFIGQVVGFRITCAPWKRERIDPIANPGGESSHMHTFWGGRNLDLNTRSADDLRSGCTSCDNQFDKSAYWMPTLYYVKKNATVPVKVAIFHVYYSGGPGRDPLPDDFSILSGDPNLTEEEYVARGGGGVDWKYEDSDEVKEPWQLPRKRGNGWLRANVGFPVWVTVDESIGRYRECDPSTETCLHIPRIFFAVWYDARDAEFFTFDDGEYFTLSSGGGHTYHGDMINGWDSHVATEVAETWAEWAAIGGEDSGVVSEECASLAAEAPYLWDLDVDALNQVKGGNQSIHTGTYDLHLTVTDGKSVNSTWNGAWGAGDIIQAEDDDQLESPNEDDGQVPSQVSSSAAVRSPHGRTSTIDIPREETPSMVVPLLNSTASTATPENQSSTAVTSSSTLPPSSSLDDGISRTVASERFAVAPGCAGRSRSRNHRKN